LALAFVKYYYSANVLITSWGVCRVAYFPGCEVLNYALYFCIIFWSIFYLVLLHIWLASKCYKFLPDSGEYETQEILRSPSKPDHFLDVACSCSQYNVAHMKTVEKRKGIVRRIEPNSKIILPIFEPECSSSTSIDYINCGNGFETSINYDQYGDVSSRKPSAFSIVDNIHTFLPAVAPPNTPRRRERSFSRRRLSKMYGMHENLTGITSSMLTAREFATLNDCNETENEANDYGTSPDSSSEGCPRGVTSRLAKFLEGDDPEVPSPGLIKLRARVPNDPEQNVSRPSPGNHRYIVSLDERGQPNNYQKEISSQSIEEPFTSPEDRSWQHSALFQKDVTINKSNGPELLPSKGSSGIDQTNSARQIDPTQREELTKKVPSKLLQESSLVSEKVPEENKNIVDKNNNHKAITATNPSHTEASSSLLKKRISRIPRPKQSVKFSLPPED
jgi:hypothetical protein